jgi:WD40 repeat protein
VFDISGRTISQILLPGWKNGSAGRNVTPHLLVDVGGIAVVQQGDRAWLLELGNECRILQVIKLIANKEEEPAEHPPMHHWYFSIVGLDLDARTQRVLSNCTDRTAICWNFAGVALATLKGRDGAEFADARFLNEQFVTGTLSGRGEIWDRSGRLVTEFRPDSGGYDLFIKDVGRKGGYFISSSNTPDHDLEVWSDSGQRLALLAKHQKHYWDAVFSPDEKLIAGACEDGVIRVWNWRKQELFAELHGHTNTVCEIRFSSDGQTLLSASFDKSVRLWTLFKPILPALRGHSGPIREIMGIGPDFVTSGRSDNKTIWWRETGQPVPLAGMLVERCSGPPAADVLATLEDGRQLHVWKLSADLDEPVNLFSVKVQDIDSMARPCVSASPDGSRVIVATIGSQSLLPELRSLEGEHLAVLFGESARRNSEELTSWRKLRAIGFHPDSSRVLTAIQDGTVWVWSARDGGLLHTLVTDTASPDALLALEVDPLGEFIATGIRHEATLWGWDARRVGALRTTGYKVTRIVFSPDGQWIITVSDNPAGNPRNFAQLWSRNRRMLARLAVPQVSSMSRIRFDRHNSRFVLIETNDEVRIFDMTGTLVGVLAAPVRGTYVTAIAVSAAGTHVAALFSDNMVRVWDVDACRRAMSIPVNASGPMLFRNDGRRLLIATDSGDIEQVAMDIADLYPGAAARLGRGLDADEAQRFYIDRVELDLARYL